MQKRVSTRFEKDVFQIKLEKDLINMKSDIKEKIAKTFELEN